MDRRLARKEALSLLFDHTFNEEKNADALFDSAALARDFEPDDFVRILVEGVISQVDKLDTVIESNLKGWRKNRLSRVSLTILRMAVYEILYLDSIPASVSINEAVELAKIFGDDKDAPFVNGLLGSVARSTEAAE